MGKVSKALSKAGADVSPVSVSEDSQGSSKESGESLRTRKKIAKNRPDSFSSEIKKLGWDERLVAVSENFPGVTESFRRLRSMILHPAEGKPARSILVTSATLGEGKTFVCANLGAIMARGVAQHALMVDCDLRRPNLAHLLGFEVREGLTDHLRDGVELSSLIYPTKINRLSLIPAGIPPENPSELLASNRMTDLVDELVNRYQDRLILLDSPPVHAASETAVLAQHVDKVVLVVRWGSAGRDQVKKIVEQIGREKILGVVFNAFEMNLLDKKMQGEGYYNYYSEGY